jgi:hypothetical protein
MAAEVLEKIPILYNISEIYLLSGSLLKAARELQELLLFGNLKDT